MNGKKKKLIVFAGLIAFFVILYFGLLKGITAVSIRDWVKGFGIMAPVAYIAVWTVLPVFFFPVPVLALAGGLSFGLVDGTIYTLIGAMLNSSLMFFMADRLAKESVMSYLSRKMPAKWWNRFIKAEKKEGFLIIFICRLIPVMPYNVINYASGLTSIKFRSYFIATLIGILPGTLVFLNVGDKILDVHSPEFFWSMVFVVALTVISIVLGKVVSKISDK